MGGEKEELTPDTGITCETILPLLSAAAAAAAAAATATLPG